MNETTVSTATPEREQDVGVEALLQDDGEATGNTTTVPEEITQEAEGGGKEPNPAAGLLSPEAKARRDADIREFLREFPEVRPSEIEPEVWEAVRQGKSLVSAFRSRKEEKLQEENRQLRARLQAEDANARNREKSIGTQRTSGRDTGRDAFLEALLSDA